MKATLPILERIIHIYTDRANHTQESRTAVDTLNRWPVSELSGFMIKALSKEKQILELISKRQPEFEVWLKQEPMINKERISLNHSMLCALIEALGLVIELTPFQISQSQELLKQMAIEREHVCGADHPLVQEFWEMYEFLEGNNEKVVNHSLDKQFIAISFNQFAEEAIHRKQNLPPLADLKTLLKLGKKHKYVTHSKTIKSAVNQRLNRSNPTQQRSSTTRCWIFNSK